MRQQAFRFLGRLIPCLFLLSQCGCGQNPPGPEDAIVVLDSSLNAPKDASCGLLVISEDPNIIWSRIRFQGGYGTQDELVKLFLAEAEKVTVTTGELAGGRAVLRGIENGKLWIVTAGLVPAGAERLLWSLPLPPSSGGTGTRELVLHRSNAALVLGPRDFPLVK